MTVGELKELLEDFNEEAEVVLAVQPNWPFEHSIGNVVEVEPECWNCEGNGQLEDPVGDCPECGGGGSLGIKVYIAEQRQVDYLPGDVAKELGWK